MSEKVDKLIERGAVQISRKYRRVFVPPGPSCIEWLREAEPQMYDQLVNELLGLMESRARGIAYHREPFHEELTSEEFSEFYERMKGKKPWTSEGKTPCPDCKSLGYMHRRDCTNYEGPR